MWASAVGIAITKGASKSWEIISDSPARRVEYQKMFLSADTRRVGSSGYLAKHLRDFLTTDNGAFTEIVRATQAYGSKIVGLRHLDSNRCTRTGDPKIPVLYRDRQERIHELKDHQVFALADMPDPGDTFYGVGMCSASRAYQAIYKLASIEKFLTEKVSGLRPLAIHIVNGILDNQLQGAVEAAKSQEVARGVSAYMGAVIVGVPSGEPPQVVTIPLAEIPQGFNRKEEFDLSILTYADALGLDPQDIQPLSGTALGTGTQSQILHEKGQGKGLVFWVGAFTHAFNEYVMPRRGTQFAFSENDLRDKKAAADVSQALAGVAQTRITAQITTAEQELQLLVDKDELPRSFLPQDQTPEESLSDDEKPDEERENADAVPAKDQAEPNQEEPAEGDQAGKPAAGKQPAAEPGGNGAKPKTPFGLKEASDQPGVKLIELLPDTADLILSEDEKAADLYAKATIQGNMEKLINEKFMR
jgi:hypothetical protein